MVIVLLMYALTTMLALDGPKLMLVCYRYRSKVSVMLEVPLQSRMTYLNI